jgi:hypothetical protein
MKTLISHEIPKQLFPQHHFINDYPYLLAHLLMEGTSHYDKEYADFYLKVVKEYSYSILDNSAFELGDSIDCDILYEIGEKYKPSHIIIPDALQDADKTIERAISYINKYGKTSTPKLIGVVQGKTVEELKRIFTFYNSLSYIDIIAVPFDLLSYNDWAREMGFPPAENKEAVYEWKTQRPHLLREILSEVKLTKKIHLLGCATPNEFSLYSSQQAKNYIHSIDTSAPIVYGWSHIPFANGKCVEKDQVKPSAKLADNLDIKLNEEQVRLIAQNIRVFKSNSF